MTKEEFFERVNQGRYPKYTLSQIKEGKPDKDCAAIVCTASGSILLAKYEDGTWQQCHFSSTNIYKKQEIYYTEISEDVVYWTDGEPEDRSRNNLSSNKIIAN